jgi:hypothetical protein
MLLYTLQHSLLSACLIVSRIWLYTDSPFNTKIRPFEQKPNTNTGLLTHGIIPFRADDSYVLYNKEILYEFTWDRQQAIYIY